MSRAPVFADVWRLVVEPPADGAWNMAVDRAIQLAREADRVPPTLRLYRWRTPTVTLGAFQQVVAVDGDACREWGVDVVRRHTGGRGVLHDDEVTYAVIAGVGDGVPRGVVASYRYLCAGLVEAFSEIGIAAEITQRDRGASTSGACYLQTTRADLSAGALKLSGSAQVWSGSTVLQHGSFTRTRDVDREAAVFGLSAHERETLASRTATIAPLVGADVTLNSIAEAVAAGMARGLKVRLEPGTLTAEELEAAERGADALRVDV